MYIYIVQVTILSMCAPNFNFKLILNFNFNFKF